MKAVMALISPLKEQNHNRNLMLRGFEAHRRSQVRMFHVYSISDQVTLGFKMLPGSLFLTGGHFDSKTQACYMPSILMNRNILCRSASKPPTVSLRQLICCPDTKLSEKACLSSYGVERLLREMWANGFWLEGGTLGSMSRHKCLRSRSIGDRGHGLDACNLQSASKPGWAPHKPLIIVVTTEWYMRHV